MLATDSSGPRTLKVSTLSDRNDKIIAIIGLGYVGLPLAVAFGKNRQVIGYDLDLDRIVQLNQGFDRTGECDPEDIQRSTNLSFTSDLKGRHFHRNSPNAHR